MQPFSCYYNGVSREGLMVICKGCICEIDHYHYKCDGAYGPRPTEAEEAEEQEYVEAVERLAEHNAACARRAACAKRPA